LSKSPSRSTRFATALSFFNNHPGHAQHYLVDALDWSNVETFVDVGGSLGASAITVAQHIPSVKCIIQDRPEIISRANAAIPDSLTDRVTIMGHNFFDEQPIKNADIYHFRRVFHNWSDKYCIKILQALVPALKPGARVIVSDIMIPRRGSVSLDRERQIR
jgi:predicted O-methyltransferase YrrM